MLTECLEEYVSVGSDPGSSKHDKWNYTLDTLKQDAMSLFSIAIEKLTVSDACTLNKVFESEVLELQDSLGKMPVDGRLQALIEQFVCAMWDSVKPLQAPSSATFDTMCECFNTLSISEKHYNVFKDILSSLCIKSTCENFIYQFLLEELIKVILKQIQGSQFDPIFAPATTSPDLTKSEEMALRYVASYLARKLLKKLVKSQDYEMKEAATILRSVSDLDHGEEIETENVLSYTREWLILRDRGGLHKISDNLYGLYKSMEVIIKPNLMIGNVDKIHKEQISCDKLQAVLLTNTDVIMSWEHVSGDITNESTKDKLFKCIIRDFVQIRLRSFANIYMFVHKRQCGKKKNSKKALRTSLKGNMN